MARDNYEAQLRTRPFKNSSGEIIPPYAAMELDYFAESGKSALELLDNEDIVFRCKKPSSSISPKRLVFNGGKPVAIGGYGDMQLDPFCIALADITTALSPDDECGPVSGSWYIQKTGSGLFFRSYDSSNAHYVSATIRTIFVSTASGSGGTGLAKSPSGGIAARSGITVGVGTCTLAELYDDSGTIKIREKSPTQSVLIYNTTQVVIGASMWIHWKTDGGYKVVDVDDCA